MKKSLLMLLTLSMFFTACSKNRPIERKYTCQEFKQEFVDGHNLLFSDEEGFSHAVVWVRCCKKDMKQLYDLYRMTGIIRFWWSDEKTRKVLGKYKCSDVILDQ
jgi:hypothetical protein